jgi:hypothetical protein
MPLKNEFGFSRWVRCFLCEQHFPQRLKAPLFFAAIVASLKRCPDTNRAFVGYEASIFAAACYASIAMIDFTAPKSGVIQILVICMYVLGSRDPIFPACAGVRC